MDDAATIMERQTFMKDIDTVAQQHLHSTINSGIVIHHGEQ
jgi:hypothetical protein